MNDNILANKNQVENLEILSDKTRDGMERPWRDKKINNEFLKDSYTRLGYEQKATRAYWCGTSLGFRELEDGTMKLQSANFCQVRLCPMCAWRRELKIFSQLSKVVQLVEQLNYRFIFLTLTCEDVYGEDLISSMDNLFKGFKRLFELKQVENSIKGYFRALEITHDTERKITKKMYKERKKYYDNKLLKVNDLNPNFNKYHPHFHVMLVVNKSYFTNKGYYITQEDWTKMWKQSLRVDYTPIVDVRAVKNVNNKGVKEVAKYSVKDADYIVKEDKQLTDETVEMLDKALSYRRLIAYGGIMKTIHKELNLTEDVTADVNIDEEQEFNISNILKIYKWNIGYKNYILEKKINLDELK